MSRNSVTAGIADWVMQIVLILFITLFISVFVLQPYEVRGSSMEPTFNDEGDMVLAFKTPYYFGAEPEYGDIVIVDSRVQRARTLKDEFIESPLASKVLGSDNRHIWIKRVIGLPGDKLEFKEDGVYRNGTLLVENYIKEETRSSTEMVSVPENHVFVMGDNRNNSSDSRLVGPVPLENVQGRVLFRYFPLNEISRY